MLTDTLTPTRWNLSDILPAPTGSEYDAILRDLNDRVGRFETRRAVLYDSVSQNDFMDILAQYDAIVAIVRRLGMYGELWFASDTQAQPALVFQRQMNQLASDIANRTLFFTLWWKALPEATAASLMENAGKYQYFLEAERLFAPYTLSEPEEKVINLKDVNGIGALLTLYEMITSRFEYTPRIEGKRKPMTRGELQVYVRDPSPRVRAAAYRELYRVYGEQGNLLAQLYAYRVQDWQAEQVRLRHFKSPIAVRNLSNHLPDAVINTLLEVCRDNAPLFQRFFNFKAKAIGMRKLRRYDIYAPLAATADKEYPYAQGVQMVLDSYHAFSPQAADLVRQVFDSQHMDSQIRPGKQTGAFCASVLPSMVPYVLMSYAGHARDVSTMAHELGHALHSLLARDQTTLTFHAPLPLAETASVFGEMLMTDRLLASEPDPGLRRDMRALQVDDAYATILRQAFFILFEREAHVMVAQGKTTDDLNALYLQNLRDQFGTSVDVSDEFKWEWVSIPHIFHTPFYTYAYSFGNLLTLALYRQYRAQGEEFKPRYMKILSYGGSASPMHILTEAGFDVTTKDFWQGGFDVIRGWIEELEESGK